MRARRGYPSGKVRQMKNKRLLIILSCLAFVAIVALSLNALFTIAEVQTFFSVSSVQGETDAEACEKLFDKYKGKNLTLFKTSRIERDVAHLPYLKIESVQKKSTNKLIITVSERLEVFAIEKDGAIYTFDKYGFVLSKKQENVNNADGATNVLIVADIETCVVGKNIAFCDTQKQSSVFAAAACFDDFRNEVKEMYFSNGFAPYLYVQMRTGTTLVLDYTAQDMADKLSFALAVYNQQPEYQKLSGYIVESGDGFVWTSRAPL